MTFHQLPLHDFVILYRVSTPHLVNYACHRSWYLV